MIVSGMESLYFGLTSTAILAVLKFVRKKTGPKVEELALSFIAGATMLSGLSFAADLLTQTKNYCLDDGQVAISVLGSITLCYFTARELVKIFNKAIF